MWVRKRKQGSEASTRCEEHKRTIFPTPAVEAVTYTSQELFALMPATSFSVGAGAVWRCFLRCGIDKSPVLHSATEKVPVTLRRVLELLNISIENPHPRFCAAAPHRKVRHHVKTLFMPDAPCGSPGTPAAPARSIPCSPRPDMATSVFWDNATHSLASCIASSLTPSFDHV